MSRSSGAGSPNMRSKLVWHPCPKCGAIEDQKCHTPKGLTSAKTHVSRTISMVSAGGLIVLVPPNLVIRHLCHEANDLADGL